MSPHLAHIQARVPLADHLAPSKNLGRYCPTASSQNGLGAMDARTADGVPSKGGAAITKSTPSSWRRKAAIAAHACHKVLEPLEVQGGVPPTSCPTGTEMPSNRRPTATPQALAGALIACRASAGSIKPRPIEAGGWRHVCCRCRAAHGGAHANST